MPRSQKGKKNPTIPAVRQLDVDMRSYFVNNRLSLQPVSRVVLTNPTLRREIEQLGGFQRVLTNPGSLTARRNLTTDLVNYQTSAYLERFLGSDITNIKPATKLESELAKIKNIATDVATELNDCCEAIIVASIARRIKTNPKNGY